MGLKLYQKRVSLKILREKDFNVLLGEILHLAWEEVIINLSLSCALNITEYAEKTLERAFAAYPEPLPLRRELKKKAKDLLTKAFKSKDFEKLLKLLKGTKVLKEVEVFTCDQDKPFIRPDIVLIKDSEWIVLELSLHLPGKDKEEQLRLYFETLQALQPNANIKAYFLTFDPFNLRLRHEKSNTNPTQLSLFKNFS